MITVQQRITGAFYGQALGDAMGMPSELWPRSRVKAHFGWIDRFLPGPAENNAACYFGRAEFTDDTSMALALADAIIVMTERSSLKPLVLTSCAGQKGSTRLIKMFWGPHQKSRCAHYRPASRSARWKTTA